MARPKSKTELTEAANTQFAKIWESIESIPGSVQDFEFSFGEDFFEKHSEAHWKRDKNLRDVLVHLYEWHCLLLNWTKSNMNGENKPFLPEPYNWKNYGEMNIGFWEKHQKTTFDEAVKMLRKSHSEVMDMIEGFSNEELFEKKHYGWTGTSNLGSYCISATSSHYDWAIKKIKNQLKFNK